MDCATDNYHCKGGWVDKSLDYVILNGLSRTVDYPDMMRDQNCQYRYPFAGLKSYRNIY